MVAVTMYLPVSINSYIYHPRTPIFAKSLWREQSFAFTGSYMICAKHLTLFHTSSLSPDWRDMYLMDGPLGA